MFNLEEFERDQVIYPLVEKLSKFLDKNKIAKAEKVIEQLDQLLKEQEHIVSITYILSILAEHDFELISESIFKKVESYCDSKDLKLRVNTLIVIGFAMLENQKYIDKYFQNFVNNLSNKNKVIRDNVHYFLQEIVDKKPKLICSYRKDLINALIIEEDKENLVSIINYLEKCNDFDFENLFDFRAVSKSLLTKFYSKEHSGIYSKLLTLIITIFPSLKEIDIESLELKKLLNELDKLFLMKRYNLTELSEKTGVTLEEFIKIRKKTERKDHKIYFYIKFNEKKLIYFYELEKEKLIKLFGKVEKLQKREIFNKFNQIIDTELELRSFLNTLTKLNHINGYYSKLGYFYSFNYVKSNLLESLNKKGMVNLKNFDYLPPEFNSRVIKYISNSTKQVFLTGKNNTAYYSLKKIQQQINTEAAKNTSIDLKTYRERLTEKDFIKLIKNLPKGYLTPHRKGTQWLTNVGLLKVKNEIENSKLIGYYSIPALSEKLNLKKVLLVEILDEFIDKRSGIFDKNRESFYYFKFLNQKIEQINSIVNPDKKEVQINLMAKELNIERSHILTKLDENLKLIEEEIKEKDQIKIHEYIEKTGMAHDKFIEFINNLGLNYFKKGDLLIFNEFKINDAKKDIKSMLIKKSKSQNSIYLGDIDVSSSIVENLLKELQSDEKLRGIFYNNEGELIFYTEKGIENLMLENSLMFSFHDIFYGKKLNDKEIELLHSILNLLLNNKKLKGTFDNETLTFASTDVLFAQNYNAVLFEFEKTINNYIKNFNLEFEKIKRILTKRNETIFPQEIKLIQETIDNINEKYVRWRSSLEAFVRKTNITLLKKQGYSVKKYKALLFPPEKKENVKFFENDPEVIDLMSDFNRWVKLFNALEVKYGNIIFYQKRLINDTDNVESRKKLDELLIQLKLT
jgi:hypothetical protein